MTNEQIIKQLMPHLKNAVEGAEAYLRMPTPSKAVKLSNLIRDKVKPVLEKLNAPGADITQTTFFEATEIQK